MSKSEVEPVYLSLEAMATEFAPLPKFDRKLLRGNGGYGNARLNENAVLRLFIALTASDCPILSDLSSFGFDLEAFRRFLSIYSGRTLRIPKKKVWAKVWFDIHIWLAVENRLATYSKEDLISACRFVAQKYNVSVAYAESVHARFERAQNTITKQRNVS